MLAKACCEAAAGLETSAEGDLTHMQLTGHQPFPRVAQHAS